MNLTIEKVKAHKLAEIIREHLGDDEDAALFAVEQETDLLVVIDRMVKSALESEALAEGLKSYMSELAERKKRLESKAEKIRAIVALALEEVGLTGPVKREAFTLSVGKSPPAVILTDESIVPEEYMRVTKSPDKKAIKDAMTLHGIVVPGAEMANGGSRLTIRVK